MPSYLTDARQSFVPTQLYQPDFGSIQGSLRMKQMQYDQGYNQVKNVYNSILNAPLSVGENQQVRQQYISNVNDQLKNLSSADLSLPQVRSQAEQVFQPFYQDQDIAADMAKTRQYQSQFQTVDELSKSKKPEEQSQVWDSGRRYIQNGYQALQNSHRGDGSIQSHQVRSFVPYVDPVKYLDDAAKEEGLKIETQSPGGPGGAYKMTRINGDAAPPLFETWAMSKLAGNSKINDVFRVQGTVNYEDKLNGLIAQGVDPSKARSVLASQAVQANVDNFKTIADQYETKTANLLSQFKTLSEVSNTVPSEENYRKLDDLKNQYLQSLGIRDSYNKQVAEYSDPNSNTFKSAYNSILNNGEAVFAESARNSMISSWARGRAANSSVKYELDPGFKENMDLQTETMKLAQQKEIADMRNQTSLEEHHIIGYDPTTGQPITTPSYGTGGIYGTGGLGGTTTQSQREAMLNTPVNIGLNIYGKDGTDAYNRYVNYKGALLSARNDAGFDLISKMSFGYSAKGDPQISSSFLGALKNSMSTGIIPDTKQFRDEYQSLQNAGIISKDIKYGEGPVRTYQAIESYYNKVATEGFKNKTIPVELAETAIQQDRLDRKYQNLMTTESEGFKKLKQDPTLQDMFSGDNIVNKNDYYKNNGIDVSDTNISKRYSDYVTEANKFSSGSSGGSLMSYDTYKKGFLANAQSTIGKQYDKKSEYFKQQFSKTGLYDNEEAFKSPVIDYLIGEEKDNTRGKALATAALSPYNLQGDPDNIDRDGTHVANITQLTSTGGKTSEIDNFLSRMGNNINGIEKVGTTQIGQDGKPTIIIHPKQSILDEAVKGKDAYLSQGAANQIAAHGLEITVSKPELLAKTGVDLNFTPNSLNYAELNSGKQQITAPQVIKDMGMDYTIQKSVDGKQLMWKINYQKFNPTTGKFDDLSTSGQNNVDYQDVDNVEKKILDNCLSLYSTNSNTQKQHYLQNPQVPQTKFQELRDSILNKK